MVVEDHDDCRAMLRLLLEMRGFEVFEASDGNSAIVLAQNINPDLILIDDGLPGIDGLTTTRLIRQYELTRNTPIIALSGSAKPEVRTEALAAGCSDWLAKPLNIERLHGLVDYMLSSASLSSESGA